MDATSGDGWLAADTVIRLAGGVPTAIGPFVDRHLRPVTSDVEQAASHAEVVAFRPGDGRAVRRQVTAVHRAAAPVPMCQVRLDNGTALTLGAGTRLFTLVDGAVEGIGAAELRAGSVCLLPRLVRSAGVSADLTSPARRALGRRLSPAELAAGASAGGVRLPLRVTEAFGWLVGVVLAAPLWATSSRSPAELPHLVNDAHTAVFGVGLSLAGRSWRDAEHPTVSRFFAELGLLEPDAPHWLYDVGGNEFSAVLAGLLDAGGTIRPAHRHIVLRVPSMRAPSLRRLLHGHGLVAQTRTSTADRCELVLAYGDAIATARLARPRRTQLAEHRHSVLTRDAGRGPSLGAQPALVSALLDDLDPGGWGGRLRAARTLAAALRVSERGFYERLAGDRALSWDELARARRVVPTMRGRTVDRLRALAIDELHPVTVTAVERDDATRPVYAVTVADPTCPGVLADDIAVGDLRAADNRPGALYDSGNGGRSEIGSSRTAVG